MSLRRRVRDLEARLEALERERFNGEMPPAPTIPTEPVDTAALWRERCAEFGEVRMVDVDDDRASPGVYL